MSEVDPKIIEAIQTTCFIKEIKQFICQAISGIYIAPYKLNNKFIEKYTNHDTCEVLAAKYLNSCWHSYWKNDDDYVVGIINRALSWCVIKGKKCIFNWFMQIIKLLIDEVSSFVMSTDMQKENNTIDEIRKILYAKIEKCYDTLTNKIIEDRSLKCTGECDDKYDEHDDLFSFIPVKSKKD